MNTTYKIHNYLICMTTDASIEDRKKAIEYMQYRAERSGTVLCLTTCGKKSFDFLNEFKNTMHEHDIKARDFHVISSPKESHDWVRIYARLELACQYERYHSPILLISDVSIEEYFKPIQVGIQFIDDDIVTDRDNTELLVEFVVMMREYPTMIIYDARSTQFLNTKTMRN